MTAKTKKQIPTITGILRAREEAAVTAAAAAAAARRAQATPIWWELVLVQAAAEAGVPPGATDTQADQLAECLAALGRTAGDFESDVRRLGRFIVDADTARDTPEDIEARCRAERQRIYAEHPQWFDQMPHLQRLDKEEAGAKFRLETAKLNIEQARDSLLQDGCPLAILDGIAPSKRATAPANQLAHAGA